MSRKPITLAEKLKLARQHKGKAATSTAGSIACTTEVNIPPPTLSPPHAVEETRPSPRRSPLIVIMDEPLNVQPINEAATNPEAEVARRENRKDPMEDE